MQANSPWRIIGVVVVLVLFVLGVFQPFGIGGLKGTDKLISLGLSGLGSFSGVVILLILFPRLFPRYYAPVRWTVGKHVLNLLAILLMTGLCIWAFQLGWFVVREGYMPVYWFEMLGKLVIAVGMVSPIPLAMTEVMLRNQHLQTYMQEVEDMNRRLTASREAADTSPLLADSAETSPASVPENDPSSVSFKKNSSDDPLPANGTLPVATPILLSGSTKDCLSLLPADLLYLEAFGNYVKIHYEVSGQVRQKLLRATIKQMEEALATCPSILRCHRAFLVNLDQVVRLQGNAGGYHLFFRQTEDEVPVSRAYTATVREKIAIRPKSLG